VFNLRVDELSEQLQEQTRRFELLQLKMSTLQDSSIDEPHAKHLIAAQVQVTRVALQADIDDLQRQLRSQADATLAQPDSDRILEQQVALRTDVDDLQRQLNAMLPSLGRQDKDSMEMKEAVAAAVRDMQYEVQRLLQATQESMTIDSESSARQEKQALDSIEVLARRVEGSLSALPGSTEVLPSHFFPRELAEQLETLVDRIERNEAQCFALQESIRSSIKDLTDTVPFTVESLARLVSLLNVALSPSVDA